MRRERVILLVENVDSVSFEVRTDGRVDGSCENSFYLNEALFPHLN